MWRRNQTALLVDLFTCPTIVELTNIILNFLVFISVTGSAVDEISSIDSVRKD